MKVNRLDLSWFVFLAILMLGLCLFFGDGNDVMASIAGPLLLLACPILVAIVLGRYLPVTEKKHIIGLTCVILIIFMFTPLIQAPDSGMRFATLATLFTFFAALSLQQRSTQSTPEQTHIKEPS